MSNTAVSNMSTRRPFGHRFAAEKLTLERGNHFRRAGILASLRMTDQLTLAANKPGGPQAAPGTAKRFG